MKKFILFYKGPATSPETSHEKWPSWFQGIGEHLVDAGSPMDKGRILHPDGSFNASTTEINGYSIIRAKNMNAVRSLLKKHPLLDVDKSDYSIEICELAR